MATESVASSANDELKALTTRVFASMCSLMDAKGLCDLLDESGSLLEADFPNTVRAVISSVQGHVSNALQELEGEKPTTTLAHENPIERYTAPEFWGDINQLEELLGLINDELCGAASIPVQHLPALNRVHNLLGSAQTVAGVLAVKAGVRGR